MANSVLVSNSYDEAYASYFNVGKLTTSTNAARTEKFYYNASGIATNTHKIDARFPAHAIANAVSADGKVLFKLYSGGLTVGNNTDRWQYDALGRLKSVPGIITAQTYEADG